MPSNSGGAFAVEVKEIPQMSQKTKYAITAGILVPSSSECSPDIGLSNDGVLAAGVDGVVGLGRDKGLGVGGRLTSERGLTSPFRPGSPFVNALIEVLEGDGGIKGNRGGRTAGGCNLGGNDSVGGSRGRSGYAAPGPSGGTGPCECGCCWPFSNDGRDGVVVVGVGHPATPLAAATLLAAAAAAFLLAFSLLLMMTSLSSCTT